MKFLTNLTDMQRGIIYSVIGFLILLDALHLLDKTIQYFILFASLGLIIYGIILTDVMGKIFKKKK